MYSEYQNKMFGEYDSKKKNRREAFVKRNKKQKGQQFYFPGEGVTITAHDLTDAHDKLKVYKSSSNS